MAFSLLISAEHSTLIAAVLDEHYQVHGIVTNEERADAEFFVKVIFVNGIQNPKRLKSALEVRQRRLEGRAVAGRSQPRVTDAGMTA